MSEQNQPVPGSAEQSSAAQAPEEQAGGEHRSGEHHHHSGEHSGSGSGSGHHHKHKHKRKIKIPKNALIIAAAVIVLAGLFVLMIRYFDQQDAEQPQLLPEAGTAATETAAPQGAADKAPENAAGAKAAADTSEAVRWCALGDSITAGWYSETGPDGGATVSVTDRESIGWPYLVAKANGWQLTSLAEGNEGYLNPAGGADGIPGYARARAMDFTPYNLVTVSFGINDWISNCPMGSMEDDPSAETITAFIPAMRATLEAIARSNPLCKIVVLLPLNVKGYAQTLGTQETNWAMGYEMESSGTLRQFTETMKDVCGHYGIEYIDLASASCVNSVNLPALLPDGIHPSAEAHRLLARELAAKIRFK